MILAGGLGSVVELGGLGGMAGTMWFVFQVLVALAVTSFLLWKFIINPRSYKDIIEVWDITNAGTVRWFDKGKWVVNKEDGTGVYKLLKNKKTQLKQPPLEYAVPNKKGGYKYLFTRQGESPFEYTCINQNAWAKGELPTPMRLSDQDWVRMQIKAAMTKRTLSGFWNQNKGSIIFITAAVLTLVLLNWVIAFASDSVNAITATAGQQATALTEIAQSLHDVANQLNPQGGVGLNEGITPPPGF